MADDTTGGRAGGPGALTPRQFEDAPGTGDWRALGRGASALFRTSSLGEGAVLLERVRVLADGADHHPDVDLRPEAVVVRVVSHDVEGLSERDVALAREISATAAELGLAADPGGVQEVRLTIDAADRERVMPFWGAVLAYRRADRDLVDPHGRWPGIRFAQQDVPRPLRNRLHVDVFVPHDVRPARVDAALAAGGRVTTEEFVPRWWTLADPEGNEADVDAWEGFDDDLPDHLVAPDSFRAADGVEDWRVLQGASAYYATGGFDPGVELVAQAARIAEDVGAPLFADLRHAGVTLRVGPPEDGWIDADRLLLAQRVQAAARALGIRADPSVLRDVQLTFDALDVPAVQRFWAATLGYLPREDTDLYDPLLRGPSVFIQPMDEPREQRNRIHVDVLLPADAADARVAAALAAGGRVVRDAEAPFWRTVTDPEGNEVDFVVVPGRAEARG
ncbi:4a-hydroxytetrahydrobiopterin dehydratase [Isoptericola sp. NEAU-Y5]|uniref:Putative pterin-4-alpha-carbinolamine dehydratase n=1 Tax=Isoptericola luteus TaxID=2879484 RepID=A0ABS7ZLW1_9MICO|nr:VOC family protein [Isoptericola sp. NEAU-Y5]MCA5894785.1 4a-hydroxytetrahydrobiopterin dehydratase [Isoptericola sp. NEAU-Y5]